MLATQAVIEVLADRVERAYRRRVPGWTVSRSSDRVWAVAAEGLWEAQQGDPSLPLDPELFVAAQPGDAGFPDPWRDLTGPEAVGRYVRTVRTIVQSLRKELRAEVRHAERRVAAGEPIGHVLRTTGPKLSPLARFVLAERAGHTQLALEFAVGALEQHRSCPLYREACRELLPPGVYPTARSQGSGSSPQPRRTRTQAHLN